jgi:uncharacterized protein
MRVVLDTNILVSALIAPAGNPAAIYNAWEQGKFTLLTCAEHLDELRATLQKPRVAELIKPYKAGRLVNQIKKLAEDVGQLPQVKRSPDPGDNFLLALAEAGNAGYLVTGDKSGLLALATHKSTRIIPRAASPRCSQKRPRESPFPFSRILVTRHSPLPNALARHPGATPPPLHAPASSTQFKGLPHRGPQKLATAAVSLGAVSNRGSSRAISNACFKFGRR